MTFGMFHSTASKIPSFYDVLPMPDVLPLVIDNSNGKACKIVTLAFQCLWAPFLIDVVHFFGPSAFLPNEFSALNHNVPILAYGCGYEYDCYSPIQENIINTGMYIIEQKIENDF